MAGVDVRIAEAEAALVTLDEAIGKSTRSLLEREGISVASPNATIRAARRVGWLSDEDARAAFDIGTDGNVAIHMYRGEIGAEIERHLAGHAALLRRWVAVLRQRKETEQLS